MERFSRRQFITGGAVAALGGTLALAGCAPSGSSNAKGSNGAGSGSSAGIGSGMGKHGQFDVEVMVTDGNLDRITVLNSRETPGMGDVAMEELTQLIVDNQTLNVDTVSGATLSSMAFIGAVSDALDQAGQKSSDWRKRDKVTPAQTELPASADVVVVGGGGAGFAAAITAADLVENPDTVVLDTSTAHRTAPGWTYGFPELSPEREAAIRTAKRIAVPGCHASGFIVLVYPLVEAGILPPDALLTCYSLTGYSGGGKKMIAEYEADELDPLYVAPRQYGLAQQHKHLREMCAIPGLTHAPVFAPIVANFYSGMETSVALFASQLCPGKTAEDIRAAYTAKYTGPVVRYQDPACADGFLSAAAMSGKDSMVVSVSGNEERILLTSVFDNLGKGASGAALECLNLVMGKEKGFGLDL